MTPPSVAERERAQHTRRTLIRIARRRQRPGSGSNLGFLKQRTTNMTWPNLTGVLADLPWAVVNAVATRLYMPERATQDLDIVVAAADTKTAQARLQAAGYQRLGDLSIGGSSWRSPAGTTVDVLEGEADWWRGAIAQAQKNVDAQGLPILPLPYLTLMKFQAGRTTDIGDITRMLGQADNETLSSTRALFGEYEPEGLEDLESLIELGRLEMGTEPGA